MFSLSTFCDGFQVTANTYVRLLHVVTKFAQVTRWTPFQLKRSKPKAGSDRLTFAEASAFGQFRIWPHRASRQLLQRQGADCETALLVNCCMGMTLGSCSHISQIVSMWQSGISAAVLRFSSSQNNMCYVLVVDGWFMRTDFPIRHSHRKLTQQSRAVHCIVHSLNRSLSNCPSWAVSDLICEHSNSPEC